PSGAALISYARYRHHEFPLNARAQHPPAAPVDSYMAFVLRADGSAPAAVYLGSAHDVDVQVRRTRERILQEAADPGRDSDRSERLSREAAAQLRRTVWDPLMRHLGTSRRAFVVADGMLQLVNFAALPTGATSLLGDYLARRGPQIHYLSAERDLVAPV